MEPTIGRVVHYNVPKETQKALHQLGCNTQPQLPATIVAVWGLECVNLKVKVDGNHPDLWVTSSTEGIGEHQWQWPQKEYPSKPLDDGLNDSPLQNFPG